MARHRMCSSTIFVNSVDPDQLAPGQEFNTIGQSRVLAHILPIFCFL